MDRPVVTVMCSSSIDGKLTPASNTSSRPFVEQVPEHYSEQLMDLRENVDAIVVGNRTIVHDDSQLLPPSGDPLQRVVVDPEALVEPHHTVLSDPHPTTMLVTESTPDSYRQTVEETDRKELLVAGTDTPDLEQALTELGDRGVEHVLLEGGGRLIYYFMQAGLVDEFRLLLLPLFVGDGDAVTTVHGPESFFPDVRLDVTRRDAKGDYTLVEGNVVYE